MPEILYHKAVEKFLQEFIRGGMKKRTFGGFYPPGGEEVLQGFVESCSKYHGKLVESFSCHPLLGAVHFAFAEHRPLCLSPEIIWLTLTQGLANHINMNAEHLRHHFVRHEGQLKIVVRRDDFVKGSPENPWPEVFAEFSHQIKAHIGEAYGLLLRRRIHRGWVEVA